MQGCPLIDNSMRRDYTCLIPLTRPRLVVVDTGIEDSDLGIRRVMAQHPHDVGRCGSWRALLHSPYARHHLSAPSGRGGTPAMASGTILVVDDDLSIRETV